MYICVCVLTSRSPSDPALHKERAGGKQNVRRKQSWGGGQDEGSKCSGQRRGGAVPTRVAASRRALLLGKRCTWCKRGSSRAGRGRRGPGAWGWRPGVRRASHGRPAVRSVRAPVRLPPRLTAPQLSTTGLAHLRWAPPLSAPHLPSPHLSTPPPPRPLNLQPPAQPPHKSGGKGRNLAPWRKQMQDAWPIGEKNLNVCPEKGHRRLPSAVTASSLRCGILGACGCPPGWWQRLLRPGTGGGQHRVGGSYGVLISKNTGKLFIYYKCFFGLLSLGVAAESLAVSSCMVGGWNVLWCIPTFNT